ncbi:hypothetical protein ACTG16_23370 [Aeromonas sp. 23P]|uniref:hypothetical protein n=1 Tax=Aeromonas sp. 23P TaxID=3452716 RepID=UPI003F79DB85|nr:hypothetical protein [Aeromonas veronii]
MENGMQVEGIMNFVFYAAIVIGIIAVAKSRFRTAAVCLGFAWFGPVALMYLQTGDNSLIYEALFRIAFLGILVWAAIRINNLMEHKHHCRAEEGKTKC